MVLVIFAVAPFAGAWIEIARQAVMGNGDFVAPFAGAWIEIILRRMMVIIAESLPSRERGLK